MTDIHSHIVPGVDDGAGSTAEALQMLDEAAGAGVDTIFATPHYSQELFENGLINQSFEVISKEAQKYKIEMFLGCEIKIQNYSAQMPEDFGKLSLGGTRYVLLELPLDRVPSYTFDLMYKIQLNGLIPVLAHPERCRKLYSEKQFYDELIDSNCLLQVDAASIIGINGSKAKKLAKRMIISGNASFIASDAHDYRGYSEWYKKAYKKVGKWIGEQKAEELFKINPSRISETAGSSTDVKTREYCRFQS